LPHPAVLFLLVVASQGHRAPATLACVLPAAQAQPTPCYTAAVYAQTIAEMLHRDREDWEALAGVLDSHSGGPVHDPESPEWEARHVYAHMARWINKSMDDFEAELAGRPKPAPPKGDDDGINARWRAEDAGISFDEARLRAHEAYDRRMRLIASVAPDSWDNPLIAIAHADGYQHYANHRDYIEAAALERHQHEPRRRSSSVRPVRG